VSQQESKAAQEMHGNFNQMLPTPGGKSTSSVCSDWQVCRGQTRGE